MTENTRQFLIERYKMLVDTAGKACDRVIKSTRLYFGIFPTLLAIFTFLITKEEVMHIGESKINVLLAIPFVGLFLNALWVISLRAYEKKIHNMIQIIVDTEIKIIDQDSNVDHELKKGLESKFDLFKLPQIESYLPMILSVPYLILIYLTWN